MTSLQRPHAALLAAIALAAALELPLVQAQTCTSADATAADAMVDHIGSWKDVDDTYRRFRQCDDGSIAEGNSEAIARLLVDKWHTLPELGAQMKRNPKLESFVLRHIDTTLAQDDLDKIAELSTRSCPPGFSRLCEDIAAAIARAQTPQK